MATNTEEQFKPFNVDLWKYDDQAGALIPLLQSAQDTYGYVSEKAIDHISHVTGIPAADIYGVVTFYAQFRTKPLGKYIIKVCNGTACHVNGVKQISDTISDELNIDYEETSDDNNFSMLSVACVGCCSLAPVVVINDETFGRLTPAKLRKILRGYKQQAKKEQAQD
ncbi:MAG: NADH-quinone oxidoreductase subunit NuoE [Candidatus Zixiibacteriota bacterium]|nr:MAG: NADH-quinone oxidoreductase subunit NuoE [candidate division Zixibacteria bacterium]